MSLPVRDFQRALHRSNILSEIRTTGLISRVDLARVTGLSKAKVTGVVADLLLEKLVVEKKTGAYQGGRRPILLAINPDGVHVMGVDISIRQIRAVILNFQAEVKYSYVTELTRDAYSPAEMVAEIVRTVQACLWQANFARDQIAGIGLGIPGLVDFQKGVIRFLPNYGWENVPFRALLHEAINHPVFMENNANNLAIAEHWFGLGKGVDNFLVISLENGIGAGLVVNGQLMRGTIGVAGEFGHVCFDQDGPQCRCGRRGCVEAYAGNNAFIREAKRLLAAGDWQTPPGEGGIGLQDVLAELQAGNRQLGEVYRQGGHVLGVALSNLIVLCNPQLVVITGTGVQAGDALFSSMFAAIDRLALPSFDNSQAKIVIQKETEADWARGSGTLVLQEIYKSPMIR